ncbi:MAG: hypothetical protein DI606_15645 [Sphingobium sp.]|uniref:phage holin family protein n=1 Tax=Sphingobium sp. TaxID=1912891 RepID=UPI000DB2E039|nr:phage holin family protein [Sphingobium sp.]PZU08138.1 MAG: hypothetical protein DI606_15645 [Sphingobium sp.]
MTNEPAEPAATPQASGHGIDAPEHDSVRSVVARLIEDGRAYASAEAEKQKLRAGIVLAGVRNAAIFGIIALILVFAAIVALMVGLIIALAQSMAPLWATLIVVGGALCIVVLLLMLAKGSISRMKKAIAP